MTEALLRAAEANKDASWIELMPDGVLIVNTAGRIEHANSAMQALSGLAPQELVGADLTVLLPPAQRALHEAHLGQYFAKPRSRAMAGVARLRLWHRAGHAVPVDISLAQCQLEGGERVLAVIRDMSAIHALHEKARHQAMHDELTGLYSRCMFSELLTQALRRSDRTGVALAVLLIDLDDFKSINDGHGHHVGDEVLQEAARRMRASLRDSDVLARLGGDEFAVLLHEQHDAQASLAVAGKLVQALGQPWRRGHHELFPGASIGVVFAPQDGHDVATLLRRADMAMYRAKDNGRGCYAVFAPQMAHQMEEKAHLQGRLKRALEADALSLHYQPQIGTASGRVVGVEALLRWRDAELGDVPPARFIPVAESTGLILPLGRWVIEQACRQIAAWCAQGLTLRVAVNVSAHQLRQHDFAEWLQTLLRRWDVAPALLELEITESTAMASRDQASAMLERIAELGVQLAFDDFGMGYSSLGQLRLLPVSRLKVDRSFIQDLGQGRAHDAVLMRAVIGLGKTLGKTVVAEGVETPAQRDFLLREGCDELQGWLFAKAVPAAQIPALAAREWLSLSSAPA